MATAEIDPSVYMKCLLIHFTSSHTLLAVMHFALHRVFRATIQREIPDAQFQYAWLLPYDLIFTATIMATLPSRHDASISSPTQFYWMRCVAPTLMVTATSEMRALFYFERMPFVVAASMFVARAVVYNLSNALMFYVAFGH